MCIYIYTYIYTCLYIYVYIYVFIQGPRNTIFIHLKMVKQQVKVIVRTRPTPDFSSNNISLDPNNHVNFKF